MSIGVTLQKKTYYSRLKSFGCLYSLQPLKLIKSSLNQDPYLMYFVGYSFVTKGYKVLNLVTERIHISRDVISHENVLPFALSPSSNKVFPLFPQANSDLAHDLFPQ